MKKFILSIFAFLCFFNFNVVAQDTTRVYTSSDTVTASKAFLGCYWDKKGAITFIVSPEAQKYFQQDTINGNLFNPIGVDLVWKRAKQKADTTALDACRNIMVKELKSRMK